MKGTFMGKKINNNRKWKLKIQAEFFETLADMLRSGFSLKQCLINLAILYPVQKNDFEMALAQLESGKTFSESIQQFLNSKIYYQLMLAESHGQLELSVSQLGKYMRQRVEQREKIRAALFYPCILFGLLIMMITVLLTWLRPIITALSEQGKQSPGITQWLIDGGKIGGMVLGLIIIIYLLYGIYWLKKQPSIARHQWLSRLPLIGNVYRCYAYYYLSFNLALLLKSGLGFHEICNFLLRFEPQTLLYQLGERLNQHLLSGREIKTFIKHYAFIPSELNIFLNKGQTNAELSEDLLIYANTMYQRLLKKVDRLINLIQPIAFLIIAIIIVGIYLSILIPIYSNLGGIS
ncbi:competence type IV pilus assembly protein ComGB [Ligilactobacillus aviarius]|uniref:competence type IV pilus assembly protein ComGB n=1 Tax=Ligilactobacillus aviarius TaxID=1606 RepID=UPI003217D769